MKKQSGAFRLRSTGAPQEKYLPPLHQRLETIDWSQLMLRKNPEDNSEELSMKYEFASQSQMLPDQSKTHHFNPANRFFTDSVLKDPITSLHSKTTEKSESLNYSFDNLAKQFRKNKRGRSVEPILDGVEIAKINHSQDQVEEIVLLMDTVSSAIAKLGSRMKNAEEARQLSKVWKLWHQQVIAYANQKQETSITLRPELVASRKRDQFCQTVGKDDRENLLTESEEYFIQHELNKEFSGFEKDYIEIKQNLEALNDWSRTRAPEELSEILQSLESKITQIPESTMMDYKGIEMGEWTGDMHVRITDMQRRTARALFQRYCVRDMEDGETQTELKLESLSQIETLKKEVVLRDDTIKIKEVHIDDLAEQISLRDRKVNEVTANLRQLQAYKDEVDTEFKVLQRKYPKKKKQVQILQRQLSDLQVELKKQQPKFDDLSMQITKLSTKTELLDKYKVSAEVEIDTLKRKLQQAEQMLTKGKGESALASLAGSQVSLFDDDRSISTKKKRKALAPPSQRQTPKEAKSHCESPTYTAISNEFEAPLTPAAPPLTPLTAEVKQPNPEESPKFQQKTNIAVTNRIPENVNEDNSDAEEDLAETFQDIKVPPPVVIPEEDSITSPSRLQRLAPSPVKTPRENVAELVKVPETKPVPETIKVQKDPEPKAAIKTSPKKEAEVEKSSQNRSRYKKPAVKGKKKVKASESSNRKPSPLRNRSSLDTVKEVPIEEMRESIEFNKSTQSEEDPTQNPFLKTEEQKQPAQDAKYEEKKIKLKEVRKSDEKRQKASKVNEARSFPKTRSKKAEPVPETPIEPWSGTPSEASPPFMTPKRKLPLDIQGKPEAPKLNTIESHGTEMTPNSQFYDSEESLYHSQQKPRNSRVNRKSHSVMPNNANYRPLERRQYSNTLRLPKAKGIDIYCDTFDLVWTNVEKNTIGVQYAYDEFGDRNMVRRDTEIRRPGYMCVVNPTSMFGLRGDVYYGGSNTFIAAPIIPTSKPPAYEYDEVYASIEEIPKQRPKKS